MARSRTCWCSTSRPTISTSRRWICWRRWSADYEGTVLLVSHDRDFIDRVATTTMAMEGDGRAVVYAGGWTRLSGAAGRGCGAGGGAPAAGSAAAAPRAAAAQRAGLSFTQAHRLEALPAEIDRLAAEIAKLEGLLADPGLFGREPEQVRQGERGAGRAAGGAGGGGGGVADAGGAARGDGVKRRPAPAAGVRQSSWSCDRSETSRRQVAPAKAERGDHVRRRTRNAGQEPGNSQPSFRFR